MMDESEDTNGNEVEMDAPDLVMLSVGIPQDLHAWIDREYTTRRQLGAHGQPEVKLKKRELVARALAIGMKQVARFSTEDPEFKPELS